MNGGSLEEVLLMDSCEWTHLKALNGHITQSSADLMLMPDLDVEEYSDSFFLF